MMFFMRVKFASSFVMILGRQVRALFICFTRRWLRSWYVWSSEFSHKTPTQLQRFPQSFEPNFHRRDFITCVKLYSLTTPFSVYLSNAWQAEKPKVRFYSIAGEPETTSNSVCLIGAFCVCFLLPFRSLTHRRYSIWTGRAKKSRKRCLHS